jgi:predicted nucleic acid-binding protein
VIHFDSSFVIDLYREIVKERPGDAFAFIESLDDTELLGLSVHVVCELRAGAELVRQPLREHERVDDMISGFAVSYPDDRFAPAYARLFAATSKNRQPVEAFDLLIATAAILENAPLVTRNVKHFSRVPGLRVLSY